MNFKLYQAVQHYKGNTQADGWSEEVMALSKTDVKKSLAKRYNVKPSDIIIVDCWQLD